MKFSLPRIVIPFLTTTAFTTTSSLTTTPPPPPESSSSSSTTTANTCSSSTSTTMTTTKQFRTVKRVLPRPRQHWVGDGFHVYPVFADLAFTEELSPLLMFDYGAPKQFNTRIGKPPLGVGQHPHRGFETVTIAFQGEIEHHDNKGGNGIIGKGDVQWMTAGRGIVHQEYHSKQFTQQGGILEMCQLWVNLPKDKKMTKPGYQAILNSKIPIVQLPLTTTTTEKEGDDETAATTTSTATGQDDEQEGSSSSSLGTARIIAGELGPTKGAAKTFSPVQMWDVTLPHMGSEVEIPFPADHTCIIFVRRGSVDVLSGEEENEEGGEQQQQQQQQGGSGGGKNKNKKNGTTKLGPQDVALMRHDGSNILRLRVNKPDSSVLIMGGEPLKEPIAAQGPFVMNTKEQISKAITDYRMGKF